VGVLALVGLLIFQASSVRADAKTEKEATRIAEKLNTYISRKQKIPMSLSAANISDVPASITFTRDSSSRYTFCAEYKSASSGFSGSSVTSSLMGAGMRDYSSYSSSYEENNLYISPTHKKGKNCQTIKPSLYDWSSDYNYDDYNYDTNKFDSQTRLN